jgi:hypothetical protein
MSRQTTAAPPPALSTTGHFGGGGGSGIGIIAEPIASAFRLAMPMLSAESTRNAQATPSRPRRTRIRVGFGVS